MGSKLPVHLVYFFIPAAMLFLKVLPVYGQYQYLIQQYTNENGLPANGITDIELDKKNGFLWVGTQAGLVRFDGKYFTTFNPPGKGQVASRIIFVARNRKGSIYCEDDNFSVYRLARDKPVFEMTDTLLVPPAFIRGGGNPALPVSSFAQRVQKRKRSAFLPPWIVFHDEKGDSSSFSFIYSHQACHYSAVRDTLLCFPDNLHFEKVLKLKGTVYFVRDNLELWKYSDSLMKLLPVRVTGMPRWNGKDGEPPRFVWRPGMKEPLLVYQQDIWTLNRNGNTLYLQPLCRACSPPKANITSIQIWEEQGIIFLASPENGLYVVRNSFFQAVRKDATTSAGRAEYAHAEITPGWVTTVSGLSFTATGKPAPGKKSIPLAGKSIYLDQQGDCWFHAGDTIVHFHRKTGRLTRIPVNDGSSKMVFAALDNRLYVISDKAIAEITGDQYRLMYILPFSPNALKNSLNPDAAVEWKPGVLVIASEKLLLFDTRKGTAPDTIPIPGLTAKVRTLLKYGDYLFVGTYGQGFYVYKNGVLKKMPLDKDRYLSYAHCFMPDEKGFCWISTNHGLFKASLQALVAAWENNLNEVYYHYFGKADGIYNTEFNGGCQPCALKLSNGRYSVPSMNGMVIFDPYRQHAPPPSGLLFIEEVLADSLSCQPQALALNILPYHLRNLRFRITVPYFGNPENMYCSYKLEPYNDTWETQDVLWNNVLHFGRLPPGEYQLILRIRNGFGPDQFGVTSIRFRILAPWYQAWWFYALCTLFFVAITWALVKWRTARIAKRKAVLQQLVAAQTGDIAAKSRQLENQLRQLQNQQIKLEEDNKIRIRLIGILTHDMLGPLRIMGYMSKKLRDAFPASDPAWRTAGAFVTVTQELESLAFNILNWIRVHHEAHKLEPEQFDLRRLVHESTEIAAALAAEKGVQLYNDVPAGILLWQYRQAMGIIVYNLSVNAMKYTEKGEIRMAGWLTDDGLVLQVTDTGMGMPPPLVEALNSRETVVPDNVAGGAKKSLFGYVIIKDLLRLTGGSMKVESTVNRRTKVTLRFRLRKVPS